jgi:hypothetical protein
MPDADDATVAGGELLEDGQEEVFSKTAVERGLVKDPNAMGPDDPDCPDGA